MANKIKWEIDGEKVLAWIDEDRYLCTNNDGEGVFLVNCERGDRKQLTGTCQFSVYGIKDKKGKMRKWIKENWFDWK